MSGEAPRTRFCLWLISDMCHCPLDSSTLIHAEAVSINPEVLSCPALLFGGLLEA